MRSRRVNMGMVFWFGLHFTDGLENGAGQHGLGVALIL